MVRVMKQQYEARAGNAAAANLRDQPGRIPFMHQDEIRVLQSFVEVWRPFVATNRHAGNQSGNFKKDRLTAILQRVSPAPAVTRLVHHDLVTKSCDFPRYAAQ